MPTRAARALANLRRSAAPLAVTTIGLLCTVAAWAFVERTVRAQQATRFEQVSAASSAVLRDRLETYVAMLRAARGFVDGLGRVPDAEEFRAFVTALELGRRFPGAQGVGFARALRPPDVERLEAAERVTGRPDFRVWPEGERDLYSAVVHLEPLDWRNARAIGFDMYSEPVRREAMDRARRTGEAAASGKVELVQEAGVDRQAGFLVYLAVYESPGNPASRLVGWVYAPFRAADLMRRTLAADAPRTVGLTVYDGVVSPEAVLFLDPGDAPAGPRSRAALVEAVIAGRTFLLRYEATTGFATFTERALPVAALLVGLAVTLLVSWIVRREADARAHAERTSRRTAFLAGAGRALAASLDYHRTLARTARYAAGRVTDLCLVCVLEPEGALWRVGHRDRALARRLEAALAAAGPDPTAPAPARHRDRTAALPFTRTTPEVAAALREAGVRAWLRSALVQRDTQLGAILFLGADPRSFSRADEALLEDLTRLAAAAVDNARLYQQAQEAVAARDAFLSIASHELKTPLTSLGLQADSLIVTARRTGSETLGKKAAVVRRNVERLTVLVSQLLDISRISAGRLDLEPAPLDLSELVTEVAEKFADEAARAGCVLEVTTPGPVTGHWDRLRLDQVLTNLLSNAIKYGPGRPVRLAVTSDGGRARLVVRDHGIGISAEDQARIFGRFERAVSRRHYGGFGLGLWIVRQLVETMGGSVRVESAAGAGATFTVELPREAAELSAAGP